MNTSECSPALRRANPRDRAGFVQAVESAEEQVRAAIATAGAPGAVPGSPIRAAVLRAAPRRP
jgi:hypothetical protein